MVALTWRTIGFTNTDAPIISEVTWSAVTSTGLAVGGAGKRQSTIAASGRALVSTGLEHFIHSTLYSCGGNKKAQKQRQIARLELAMLSLLLFIQETTLSFVFSFAYNTLMCGYGKQSWRYQQLQQLKVYISAGPLSHWLVSELSSRLM